MAKMVIRMVHGLTAETAPTTVSSWVWTFIWPYFEPGGIEANANVELFAAILGFGREGKTQELSQFARL